MGDRLLPQNIAHIGDELAIAWSDGVESFVKLDFLRRYCPCAGCGGEPDVLGRIERPEVTYTPKSFELRTWRIVGGYAFQPTWEDGHGTGLYSFTLLRLIADTAAKSTSA
jgi:DUF971 family protein